MITKPDCHIKDCLRPAQSMGYCKAHHRKYVFLASHTIYPIWNDIVQRCVNPKNPSFPKHGGQGIKVCERWRASYRAFELDIGLRPSTRHRLDRIDRAKDYEPGNCRWATPAQRVVNSNVKSNNTSGTTGVTWVKTRRRWQAVITLNRRRHHLGWFVDVEDAVKARYKAEARYTV